MPVLTDHAPLRRRARAIESRARRPCVSCKVMSVREIRACATSHVTNDLRPTRPAGLRPARRAALCHGAQAAHRTYGPCTQPLQAQPQPRQLGALAKPRQGLSSAAKQAPPNGGARQQCVHTPEHAHTRPPAPAVLSTACPQPLLVPRPQLRAPLLTARQAPGARGLITRRPAWAPSPRSTGVRPPLAFVASSSAPWPVVTGVCLPRAPAARGRHCHGPVTGPPRPGCAASRLAPAL